MNRRVEKQGDAGKALEKTSLFFDRFVTNMQFWKEADNGRGKLAKITQRINNREPKMRLGLLDSTAVPSPRDDVAYCRAVVGRCLSLAWNTA